MLLIKIKQQDLLHIVKTFMIQLLKPGLHIVVRIAEHACDEASNRVLKFSAHLIAKFLVRDQCL